MGEVDTIHWRVEHVEQLRKSKKKGEFLHSPKFSACGLSGFSFHFYPKGDDFADEGYCSVYFHIPVDTRIERTLFCGKTKHGPAEADAMKNNGVSEMCVLTGAIDKATGSVVIGVEGLKLLSSPDVVEQRTKIHLTNM